MYKMVIKTVGKVYEAIDIFFGRLYKVISLPYLN